MLEMSVIVPVGSGILRFSFKILICRIQIRPKMDRIRNLPSHYVGTVWYRWVHDWIRIWYSVFRIPVFQWFILQMILTWQCTWPSVISWCREGKFHRASSCRGCSPDCCTVLFSLSWRFYFYFLIFVFTNSVPIDLCCFHLFFSLILKKNLIFAFS